MGKKKVVKRIRKVAGKPKKATIRIKRVTKKLPKKIRISGIRIKAAGKKKRKGRTTGTGPRRQDEEEETSQ